MKAYFAEGAVKGEGPGARDILRFSPITFRALYFPEKNFQVMFSTGLSAIRFPPEFSFYDKPFKLPQEWEWREIEVPDNIANDLHERGRRFSQETAELEKLVDTAMPKESS